VGYAPHLEPQVGYRARRVTVEWLPSFFVYLTPESASACILQPDIAFMRLAS
jgi:hypothetical protein